MTRPAPVQEEERACVWCGAIRIALPSGMSTWIVELAMRRCSGHVTIRGET